jgi:major membrane immunogen (membrane-anchored lipoprotein)
MPGSYIKFLLDTLTGWDWNANVVDVMTGAAFSSALVISAVLNISDFKKKISSQIN